MSCLKAYATLRIFSDSLHPDEITRLLGVEPTKRRPINPDSKYRHEREHHYWGWSSHTRLSSLDGLEHVAAVLALLHGKEQHLHQLQDRGCQTDISCYGVSSGQGGPSLDVPALAALGCLRLPIWWDVYFGDPEDYADGAPKNREGSA